MHENVAMVALTHHQAKKVEAGRSRSELPGDDLDVRAERRDREPEGLAERDWLAVEHVRPRSDVASGRDSRAIQHRRHARLQRTTSSPAFLQVVLAILLLQLLTYRIARLRGLNVDQPRNLAKTVTVE